MIHLIKKKKNSDEVSECILVAESKEDYLSLEFLFKSHIVFGMYLLYNYIEDKLKTKPEAKFLMTNYPLAFGFARINVNSKFVPRADTEQIKMEVG